MKRLLLVLLLGAVVSAWGAQLYTLRANGVNGTTFSITDSTTGLKVDTVGSDTVAIDTGADYVSIALALTGFTRCDSCTASKTRLIVQALTYYPGISSEIIWTDTFTATLDSTVVLRKNLVTDTLIEPRLWIRTIFQDSMTTSTAQTTTFRTQYNVLVR